MVQQGFIKTKDGARIYLYRAITPNTLLSSTEWLPETRFKIGINSQTPNIDDVNLTQPIPISTGVVNDNGENMLTGSDGGEDSTSNTTTFKPGAQEFDNTAQNLKVNDTSTDKTWSLTLTQPVDENYFVGLWLFFRNNSRSVMSNITIKLGYDSSNYYYKEFDPSNLNDNWNWLVLGKLNELDETGTVSGDIEYFEILITTNNATDEWDEEDVIYDLLRSYQTSDLFKNYVDGFPEINFNNLEITKKSFLSTVNAVGFNINGYGDFNLDTIPKMGSKATISTRAKTDSDEIIFTVKERIIL